MLIGFNFSNLWWYFENFGEIENFGCAGVKHVAGDMFENVPGGDAIFMKVSNSAAYLGCNLGSATNPNPNPTKELFAF